MQSHTLIGSYILSRVERFDLIADIVRHHHERWDGEGYPDGLAGEQIPFGARIIAICDSIDAMLSDRSYRRALSPETCRLEIEKNAGKMYDERVASVALRYWETIIEKRKFPPVTSGRNEPAKQRGAQRILSVGRPRRGFRQAPRGRWRPSQRPYRHSGAKDAS